MPITSPFPGMDPWLEGHWGDIHHRIITYVSDQLQPKLPSGLRARTQERVFLERPEGPQRVSYPDVRIVERSSVRAGGTEAAVAVLAAAEPEVAHDAAEPVVVEVGNEPITEGYVEIVEAGSGQRVVTVIEVLSRKNKTSGPGRQLYKKKQEECQEGKVNLVEIDLLRAGKRSFIARQESIPRPFRTTYQACVWRGAKPFQAEVYGIPLTGRLPAIRIPLRKEDADVRLDLQALIEQAYRNGGYDDIDYKADPDPPLDHATADWADQILRAKGLR